MEPAPHPAASASPAAGPRVEDVPGFAIELAYWDRELSLQGSYPLAIRQRTDPALMQQALPPHDLLPRIDELTQQLGRRPRVLDVGSGPLSMLAHGPQTGSFDLVATDPLAAHYQRLLQKHGYTPAYPQVPCFGERLGEAFAADSFDLVWIHNALDHSQQPHVVLQQAARVLRPGGYLLVQGWSREGTAEHWSGLHQHDLFLLPGGRLMCETRRGLGRFGTLVHRVLPFVRGRATTRRLDEGLALELVATGDPTPGVKQWIRVVWRKQAPAGRHG
jgi:SAM-dependent methyltransferase